MKYFIAPKSNMKTLKILTLVLISGSVLSPFFVNCTGGFRAAGGSLSANSLGLGAPSPGSISGTTPIPVPASTGIALGTSPMPKNIGQLFGCKNPYLNNSLSFSDWGSSSSIYVDTNSMTQIGNYPSYKSNSVFWTSREAGPGIPVLMSGAFTSSVKTIRILPVTSGMADWQTPLRASKITVSGTNLASTGLRFAIPASFPSGAYAVRIEDPSAAAVELLINLPTIEWALGVPTSSDPLEAPKHQIYTCGAEAGGILRIFGKNFLARPTVVLHDQNNGFQKLAVLSSDESSISVSVPASVAAGSYYLWLGNSTQDAASSVAQPITIYPNSNAALSMMSCNGLKGDGSADNTSVLSKCFSANRASASAANPFYLSLPAGNFVITNTVTMYPHQYLIGASMATTTIIGKASTPPTTWIQGGQWFGIENLSFAAPVSNALIMSDQSGDPVLSGHILLNNVNVYSGADSSNGNQQMIMVTGPDIRVLSSTIDSSSNVSLAIIYGDGVLMAQNTFTQGRSNWISMEGDQNCISERNSFQGDPGESVLWAGIFFSRPFWDNVPSMITQNVYSGYNTYKNLISAQGQGISTDGGTQGYLGMTSASTSSTVTLSNSVAYSTIGVSNPQTLALTIVQGYGVGEYRMVQSINGQTVTVDRPFDVVPDRTSIVSLTSSVFRINVSHSTFTNVSHGAIVYFGNTFDSNIENNQIVNGQMAAQGESYGNNFLPMVNLDMIGNSVMKGENTLFDADPTGAGNYSRDYPGCLISGAYLRANTVEAPLTFNFANSVSGISAYLMEGNSVTFDSYSTGNFIGTNPGMLLQNNN